MIKSREVISASLEHALVANRALAAVASDDLGSQENQDAVEDGLRFLHSMITGARVTNSLSVSPDSYGAALAYGEGVRAFKLVAFHKGGNAEPIVYLNALIETASALRQHDRVDQNAIQEFTNFFKTIRDLAFASGELQVERVV